MALKMEATLLDALADGVEGTIVSLDLSGELLLHLDAMGIAPGRGVCVLRRAAFGGPLHVRLDTGAEFALDRDVAHGVRVGGGA